MPRSTCNIAMRSACATDPVAGCVARRFGLNDVSRVQPPDHAAATVELCRLARAPGRVIALTGPSGSGKTRMLEHLRADGDCIDLDAMQIDPERSPAWLVARQVAGSTIALKRPAPELIDELLRLLARCGMAEAHLLVRPAGTLSQGETFRLRLALALAQKPQRLVCDEFGAMLDDIVAGTIAANLRRLADRLGVTVIVAAPRDGFLDALQPDVHVRFRLNALPDVRHCERVADTGRAGADDPFELVRGSRRDWPPFARWHYRSHTLGFVSHVFLLRHRELDEAVGICVIGIPQLHSAARNALLRRVQVAGCPESTHARGKATRAFTQWLNRSVRVVHRVVIDPRFRGCGLGARIVRQSIEQLDDTIALVECFTSLGGYSGFLDAAGFARVGAASEPDAHVERLCEWIAARGFASGLLDDERSVRRWYRGLTSSERGEFDGLLAKAWRSRMGARGSRWHGRKCGSGLAGQAIEGLADIVRNRGLAPFYFAKARDAQVQAAIEALARGEPRD
ncbi:MAG: ATP-binding cassette domain-containing protein [Planctomycetota bacterium]